MKPSDEALCDFETGCWAKLEAATSSALARKRTSVIPDAQREAVRC